MRILFFCISIVISLFNSCVKAPVPQWMINKERVLAIKSYPAETTENALLEALAVGPNGAVDPFAVFWVGSSMDNVSNFSKGKEKNKFSGKIMPPIGNLVSYFLPVTPGNYMAIAILKNNKQVINLKEINKVTEVTNRNPVINDLIFSKRILSQNDIKDNIKISADYFEPDNDKVKFSWYVTDGTILGCSTQIEEWSVDKRVGYHDIFAVTRDKKGGIDWKAGEVFVGSIQDRVWLESGGILYPADISFKTYPDTFTYTVSVLQEDSMRGFKIKFFTPVTVPVADTVTLDRIYLKFDSCSGCNMVFRKVKE